MSSSALAETNKLPEWKVESLRFTAFPTSPGGTDEEGIWSRVIGQDPDIIERKAKIGQRKEEGGTDIGLLNLTIQPVRIEWLLRVPPPKENLEDFPNLGSFSQVLPRFMEYMIRWLKMAPAIGRLAFGTVLIRPVADMEEGYRELSRYLLELRPDASTSSDLFYQINRPRKSFVTEGLVLNRLSKWSCVNLRSAQFTMSQEGLKLMDGGSLHATRLELDINNKWDGVLELEKGKLAELFQEQVSLAKEIAEKGERP